MKEVGCLMVHDIEEIMDEYYHQLQPLISPLAQDWEAVLFKAMETLRSIEVELGINMTEVRQNILPLLTKTYDEQMLNKGIIAVRNLMDEEENKFLLEKYREVLAFLFAVKMYKKEDEE